MVTLTSVYNNGVQEVNELMNLTNYSKRSINRHLPTLEQSGEVTRKKYERASKITAGQLDLIETWLEEASAITFKDIAAKLATELQLTVSAETVSRRL